MKKLFCLSFTLLAFSFQGSLSAQSLPDESLSSDEVEENFCQELEESGVQDENELAEMVRSSIAELDNPSMEQIIALGKIAVKLEQGKSINSICK